MTHSDRDRSEVPAGLPLHEPTDRDGDNVPSDRAEVERVWRWFETDAAALRERAEKAEATIARVEALADSLDILDGPVVERLRAALRGPAHRGRRRLRVVERTRPGRDGQQPGGSLNTQTCIRGCALARQHVSQCDDEDCRGCLPRPASHGLLCYPCHVRLRQLLQSAAVQHELLLVTAGKSDEQTFTVETIAKTHQPPRTSSDGRFPAPYARSVTVSMSQSEPVRLAALDAAQELSDWLSQVVEMLVQRHDLTGPKRLRKGADPREWKWHPVAEDGAASDFDPLVKIGHGNEATWGQYILTDPPAVFEIESAANFLLAWLDRLEAMEIVGDEFEAFGEIMSQCHSLAPWREEMARLRGIPCPTCHANSLARFGGDENVTCIRCNESIPPERYAIWVRMLADEHREGA